MSEQLPHWGNWRGRVIKAIAIDGAKSWDDIRNQTGLSPKSLNQSLAQLLSYEAIEKISGSASVTYKVEYNLYKTYKTYFESSEKSSDKVIIKQEDQKAIIQWIGEWKDLNAMQFHLQSKHFYLQGPDLSEFSDKVIKRATSEVIVVNPFMEPVAISETLAGAVQKGISTTLVTRQPNNSNVVSQKETLSFLNSILKSGVNLFFNERVHAKLIIIDRTIGIVSSMNFYSTAVSSKSWEAGMITFSSDVVEEMLGSVLSLKESFQTEQITTL